MKKFTLAILLLTSVISYAQTDLKKSEIKTTYEEYNFLTERYASDDNIKMLDGYEFKWTEKKVSPPKVFLESYENSTFNVVHKNNYLDFIS